MNIPPTRTIHRFSALIIAGFILAHLANHVVGLRGQEQHIAFMRGLRPFYRSVVVEAILISALALQMLTGLRLVVSNWKSRGGFVAWAQALSGCYLATFLFIHVTAVMVGRHVLNIDTDFRFAAAGFQEGQGVWFFGPYYFFAVTALCIHSGCGLAWILAPQAPERRKSLVVGSFVMGAMLATAIVLALAGTLYPIDIPDEYRAIYR